MEIKPLNIHSSDEGSRDLGSIVPLYISKIPIRCLQLNMSHSEIWVHSSVFRRPHVIFFRLNCENNQQRQQISPWTPTRFLRVYQSKGINKKQPRNTRTFQELVLHLCNQKSLVSILKYKSCSFNL